MSAIRARSRSSGRSPASSASRSIVIRTLGSAGPSPARWGCDQAASRGASAESPRTSATPAPRSIRARLEPRAAQRRDRDDAGGAVVERSLELVVDAVEALLGEVERGGVLVQPLEHRAQRGLGLRLGLSVRAQPGRGAGTELARGSLERGELRELRPVRADVLGGQRAVAVEDRAGARLLRNVEAELVSRLDGLHEGGGGFQREVAKGRVEGRVAHGGEFATARLGSCRYAAASTGAQPVERRPRGRASRARSARMSSISGSSARPFGVSTYSTRGGTSG